MKITFQTAKNGEITALSDNIFLHSNYNPTKEAERFISSIEINYDPPIIILIEPCLSYITKLLKVRFKQSKIIIVRFTEDFQKYNENADYIFNFYTKQDFNDFILSNFSEDIILNSLILEWPPSKKAFPDLYKNIGIEIKQLFEKCKTILITREYFEKKWLLNSLNFLSYVKNTLVLNQKINKPVLIISSGPSLRDALNLIKEHRNNFFIICLSSAIKVALYYKIIPDLCFSTDGGFWAGQHLKSLNLFNIPLALPLESFCPKSILANNKILPLNYNDGLSSEIAKFTKIPCIEAERNGTVSGTALSFALKNSINDIYICGLDLANQSGYQHCPPNEIELNNSLKDCRIKSKELRNTYGQFSEGVLNIYLDWFKNVNIGDRKVYRIIDIKYKKNELGNIKSLSINQFNEKIKKMSNTIINNKTIFFENTTFSLNKTKIFNYITNLSNKEIWINNLFPLSQSSLKHNKDNADIVKRIEKENSNLLLKIGRIFNEL